MQWQELFLFLQVFLLEDEYLAQVQNKESNFLHALFAPEMLLHLLEPLQVVNVEINIIFGEED